MKQHLFFLVALMAWCSLFALAWVTIAGAAIDAALLDWAFAFFGFTALTATSIVFLLERRK